MVVSLLLGLAFGAAADRSVSLGFYMVGAFLAFAGFFLGNRGPMRPVGEGPRLAALGGVCAARAPTSTARRVVTGGLLALLGFVLLAIGIAVDSRYQLI